MRTLELWEGNIRKKYGSVASSSTALERVLLTLQSRSGLQRVLSCFYLPEFRSMDLEYLKVNQDCQKHFLWSWSLASVWQATTLPMLLSLQLQRL